MAKRSQPVDATKTRKQMSDAVYRTKVTVTEARRPLPPSPLRSIHVGNPKASRPVSLRALHGVRLQTQNAAAHEIILQKYSAKNRMLYFEANVASEERSFAGAMGFDPAASWVKGGLSKISNRYTKNQFLSTIRNNERA